MSAIASMLRRRPAVEDPEEYLRQLEYDDAEPTAYEERMAQPFMVRVLRPMAGGVSGTFARALPSNHLREVHHQLMVAGLATQIRAEEFVAAQALAGVLAAVVAVLIDIFVKPPTRMSVAYLLLFPVAGLLAPSAWLKRKVSERKEAIRRDLPDMLDLLAISVEAGMGFEGALEIVCENFSSPLAQEFSRTLKEMELGVTRREALSHLKKRTEVPDLANFLVAITQSDALGMPIGRVLRTQAEEMRSKRRQWAREKAGKLPIKILFPVVVFIFPPVLGVVLGPAGASIAKVFR